ncbi:MAG: DMT family transporter [Wenzhouxiangella sp.]|nr:DMT family transporter [Wenzhouxiangella sp.]
MWLLIAVLALGTAPLAHKLALTRGASALLVASTSALITAVAVFGWLVARGRADRLRLIGARQAFWLLLIGVLGSGLVSVFGILAMTETSASNRALFQSAYPAATALAARMLLGERLNPRIYAWIGLVCAGLLMMNMERNGALSLTGWPFWLLLSTLPMIGLADVIAKRSLSDQEPEVVAAGRAFGGALILILALPWAAGDAGDALVQAWPWLLLSGLCMAVFTVALYQVFDRTFATVAASLIALAPLLTLMGEIGFLGLSLGRIQWVGFALVLLAVIGLSRRA